MSLANAESNIIRDSIEASRGTELPQKAIEVLDGARRVLDREGADKLTLRAVAKEAGVPSSLAIYYFGSMAQLEALLLDSIWRDEVTSHLRNLDDLPLSLSDRVDILVNFHSSIARNLDGFRTYCELLTNIIRDEDAKRNVARIYEGYRAELNFPFLVSAEHTKCRTRANAAVILAAGEGLPLARLFGDSEQSMLNGFNLLSEVFKRELLDGDGHGFESTRCTESPTSPDMVSSEPEFTDFKLNATSRKLLSAGTQLLHRGGIREITYGNISAECGESKSLISYYFKSKQGFISALTKTLIQEWSRRAKSALIEQHAITPNSLVRTLFGDRPILLSLILLQPTLRHDPACQEMARSAYVETVESLSTRFQCNHSSTGPGPAGTAATVFLAALNGLALQSLYDMKGFDLKSALQALLHILPPQDATSG